MACGVPTVAYDEGGPAEIVLHGQTEIAPPDDGWENRLYRTLDPRLEKPRGQSVELTAIPYYAWANREPGPMQVWLRTR